MQLFLIAQTTDDTVILSKEESRHCIKVLRHVRGDEIYLTDGKGMAWRGEITDDNRDATVVRLVEELPDFGEHEKTIRLIFSPLRLRDRLEWMMEKAVELGVNELIPVRTERTDKYKAVIKPERIRTILSTAAKQSLRSRIPVLREEQTIQSLIEKAEQESGLRFIARSDASLTLTDLEGDITAATHLSLMIGPEGDFTDEEMALMTNAGFTPVNLGHQRLRSETAAIFGLSGLKLLLGY